MSWVNVELNRLTRATESSYRSGLDYTITVKRTRASLDELNPGTVQSWDLGDGPSDDMILLNIATGIENTGSFVWAVHNSIPSETNDIILLSWAVDNFSERFTPRWHQLLQQSKDLTVSSTPGTCPAVHISSTSTTTSSPTKLPKIYDPIWGFLLLGARRFTPARRQHCLDQHNWHFIHRRYIEQHQLSVACSEQL